MATVTTPGIDLNNGVTIPALGLGVFQSPPEETLSAVQIAIESCTRISTSRTSARSTLATERV